MTGQRPFADVVSQHGPTVLRVCRAMLGHADADDAWSETFLAALRAYPQLAADANEEAWLVTIAHRKVIDLVRKAKRSATPLADVPDEPVSTGDPGGEVDLTPVLAGLSERQRYAVAYHYLAGLPYAEVAAVMGSSTDAARRAASDGIAKLRRARASGSHPEDTHETMGRR